MSTYKQLPAIVHPPLGGLHEPNMAARRLTKALTRYPGREPLSAYQSAARKQPDYARFNSEPPDYGGRDSHTGQGVVAQAKPNGGEAKISTEQSANVCAHQRKAFQTLKQEVENKRRGGMRYIWLSVLLLLVGRGLVWHDRCHITECWV